MQPHHNPSLLFWVAAAAAAMVVGGLGPWATTLGSWANGIAGDGMSLTAGCALLIVALAVLVREVMLEPEEADCRLTGAWARLGSNQRPLACEARAERRRRRRMFRSRSGFEPKNQPAICNEMLADCRRFAGLTGTSTHSATPLAMALAGESVPKRAGWHSVARRTREGLSPDASAGHAGSSPAADRFG